MNSHSVRPISKNTIENLDVFDIVPKIKKLATDTDSKPTILYLYSKCRSVGDYQINAQKEDILKRNKLIQPDGSILDEIKTLVLSILWFPKDEEPNIENLALAPMFSYENVSLNTDSSLFEIKKNSDESELRYNHYQN